jgi:hypothetical protein
MEQTELVNETSIPGESLTSGIKELPYDRPPAMTDNTEIQENLWKSLSTPAKLREIGALLEVGVPVAELSAQLANGMFREGKIAAQNAVMVLPSLTIMIARIGEAMQVKGMRLVAEDSHGGVSKAEIRAAIRRAEGSGSAKETADTNNKETRGFKAVVNSAPDITKKANNVGFLGAAKEKI